MPKVALAALATTVALSSQAAAAETSVSLPQEAEEPEYSFGFSQTNDSLPEMLEGVLDGPDRNPFTQGSDDDGFTAEVRFDVTRTQGDEQWVGSGGLSMLTQQGAWLETPEYQGLRTDLVEVAVQRNQRRQLNDQFTLTTGLGAGVQASGNLGGRDLQEWFHINGGFGGRVGDQLQQNYSTTGYDVVPMLTGGAEISWNLDGNDTINLNTRLEGNVALGRGFSSLRSETGLAVRPLDRLSIESGFKLDAVHANHPAYNFADLDGVRPGYYTEANFRISKRIHGFARFEDGGFRNEPVYTIGFRIGGGSRPWLDPLTQ